MCDTSRMVFFEALRGGSKKDDVVITKAKTNGAPAVRISLSNEAIDKIGKNTERILVGLHPDFRNRLYFFDNKRFPEREGYKLVDSSKSSNGTRKYIRVDSRSQMEKYNLMNTIGSYRLERDKDNELFIALKTTI